MILVCTKFALNDALRPQRIAAWLFAVGIVFLVGLFWRNIVSSQMSPLEAYGQLAQVFVYRITALAAAVLSMGVIAQEIEQKTVVYLLTRSIPRWQMLLGRILAAIVLVAAVGILAALAGSVAVMGPRAVGSPEVTRDMFVVVLGACAYVPLFVFISLLVNRAMIVSLLFAFGWETFAQNLSGMRPLSVLTYMNGVAAHKDIRAQGMLTFFAGDMAVSRMSFGLSLAVLVGVGLAFTLIGAWWFTHFAYSPREDAE